MLGVPTATLRTWEERYGIVMPDRSPGGHRLYTRDHVEQLRFVLRSIEQGMQPADAHRLLTDRLGDDPDRRVPVTGSETRLVIMLAERDPHAAELAEYFLRTEGYETIMALEAREAEAVFEERSPQLAVVDLLISGGAGPGLCRTFRERGALVLAISPLESRDEALEYGADAFLQKPLDPLAAGLDGQRPARAERVPPSRGALAMSDRVSSGSRRLNAMLGGGLPGNGINLIIGLPGSGKTILAQQYAFHSATPERPAIYLSTVSEPLEKILRYGQTLSFFDQKAVGTAVFYEDLGGTLNDEGLPGVLERIGTFLKERRPGMIVIDSFKALHPYAQRDEDFRRFLHELAGRLSAFPVTSFWVGEYGHEEIAAQPSSRSPTRSCRSPSNGKGSARYGSSRCSSCVGATSSRASTLTGSPATGSSSSLDWPIRPIRRRTSWTTSGSPRASRSSTRCSGEGIGPGPRPSWRVRRDPARR